MPWWPRSVAPSPSTTSRVASPRRCTAATRTCSGRTRAPSLTATEVNEVWQRIKAEEKKKRTYASSSGLPETLPALLYAAKALERGGVAPDEPTDLGERLLALVAEAVASGVDPEQALRDAVRRAT